MKKLTRAAFSLLMVGALTSCDAPTISKEKAAEVFADIQANSAVKMKEVKSYKFTTNILSEGDTTMIYSKEDSFAYFSSKTGTSVTEAWAYKKDGKYYTVQNEDGEKMYTTDSIGLTFTTYEATITGAFALLAGMIEQAFAMELERTDAENAASGIEKISYHSSGKGNLAIKASGIDVETKEKQSVKIGYDKYLPVTMSGVSDSKDGKNEIKLAISYNVKVSYPSLAGATAV